MMRLALSMNCFRLLSLSILIFLMACTSTGTKESNKMKQKSGDFSEGTYGYDVAFLSENNVETIELTGPESKASILVVPDLQGRVMTSTANGKEGASFGWINYKLFESGEMNNQFNPFGGEERFWLGPEGGPFSIYFDEGKEQVFENWRVPAVIDTEPYEVVSSDPDRVTLRKSTVLQNASGTTFNMEIERTVSLLPKDSLSTILGLDIPSSIHSVGYQTNNSIKNTGENAWTKESGLVSIWMLCMFNPTPSTTVCIPYETEAEGVIVNDDYFGKVPSDRLIVEDGTVFFKIDGKHRSKIGLPYPRARSLCGSYDSDQKVLTLLWCSLPEEPQPYVNSKWGEQDDPYNGDAINSYNDGPVEDGSIMGPFYEIETSSPGAALQPLETMSHVQRIIHFQGDEEELARIIRILFNLELTDIAGKFQ